MIVLGESDMKMSTKNKMILLSCVIVLAIITVVSLLNFDMNKILETVEAMPIGLKVLSMIGLIAAQIFLAFLPGEPLELASGYLFGAWNGTLICLIGSFLGTLLVYGLVRIFRHKIIDVMFASDKVKEAEALIASKKSMFWIFVLFLIPGSPKDVMTYLVSLGNIRLVKWLALTTIGRIPSIITSTFLSASFKSGDLVMTIMIALITLLLVIGGAIYYKRVIQKNDKIV